ncbi:MAG: hypothetical protein NTW61_01335 [Candidatus Melainabacteria bacterium]|nr:hypothetical protein [Candidatus Melainabacteria bacterium]
MKREATESFPYSRIFVGAGLCASPSNRQSQTRYLKRGYKGKGSELGCSIGTCGLYAVVS